MITVTEVREALKTFPEEHVEFFLDRIFNDRHTVSEGFFFRAAFDIFYELEDNKEDQKNLDNTEDS